MARQSPIGTFVAGSASEVRFVQRSSPRLSPSQEFGSVRGRRVSEIPAAAAAAAARIAANDSAVRQAVVSVGEAAYHWIIESDEISGAPMPPMCWVARRRPLATGRGFASLLDADNFTSRYDAVMRTAAARRRRRRLPSRSNICSAPRAAPMRHRAGSKIAGAGIGGPDGRPPEPSASCGASTTAIRATSI